VTLDLEKMTSVISTGQEIRDKINALEFIGTPWVIKWTSGGDHHEHEITRGQESTFRTFLLDYWNAEFEEVEKQLEELIGSTEQRD